MAENGFKLWKIVGWLGKYGRSFFNWHKSALHVNTVKRIFVRIEFIFDRSKEMPRFCVIVWRHIHDVLWASVLSDAWMGFYWAWNVCTEKRTPDQTFPTNYFEFQQFFTRCISRSASLTHSVITGHDIFAIINISGQFVSFALAAHFCQLTVRTNYRKEYIVILNLLLDLSRAEKARKCGPTDRSFAALNRKQ